jgi:hypothetical protein
MRKLFVSALALLAAASLSADTILYSTTDFSGWFLGTKPTISSGDLLTTASTTNAALTYFATPGDQYTMSVGETLSLSASFTMASGTSVSSSRTFYMTLQNSGSTDVTNNQVTANLAGSTANALFGNYTGYGLLINPGPNAASAGQFDVRSGSNTNIVGSTTPWVLFSTGTASSAIPSTTFTLDSLNNYEITYTITQVSATEMDFSYTLANTTTNTLIFTASATATSLSGTSLVTSFDTIALGVTAAQTGSYKFFDVTLTSSIPEPSTYGLGVALLAVAYAGWRRRSKLRAV